MEADEAYLSSTLPEMLARDLEMSDALFQSRGITAGSPPPSLAAESHYSLHNTSLPKILAQAYELQPREELFGTIQKQRVQLRNTGQQSKHFGSRNHADVDLFSDSSSIASSMDMEPQSARPRKHSVLTAATSVTSGRGSAQSSKTTSPSPADEVCQRSWIDIEPDTEDEPRPSFEAPSIPMRPSPSPDVDGERATLTRKSTKATCKMRVFDPFHLPIPSDGTERPRASSGSPSIKEGSWLSEIVSSVPVPNRRSSLRHDDLPQDIERGHHLRRSRKFSVDTGACQLSLDDIAKVYPPRSPFSTSFAPSAATCSTVSSDAEDTDTFDECVQQKQHIRRRRLAPRPPPVSLASLSVKNPSMSLKSEPIDYRDFAEIEPEPTPPLYLMHNWLESSAGVDTQFRSNAAIPLPPEVIETLRVSVVGFPETMLLTSSLSIETIRNYSRKIRHHTQLDDLDDNSLLFDPYPGANPESLNSKKRWKLPNLLLSKGKQMLPLKSSYPGSSNKTTVEHNHDDTNNHAKIVAPNWSSLKNMFPSGSEYLCDALYAHLVAYNYVSTLCADTAAKVAPTTPDLSDKSDTQSCTQNRIPKKAASLLGLADAAVGVTSKFEELKPAEKLNNGYYSRKVSAAHLRRISGGPKAVGGSEGALCDLQAGLANCISRLVSTLKLTSNCSGTAPAIGTQIDPLLLQAMGEIVRCTEENM